MENKVVEVNEAIDAGKDVLRKIDNVIDNLGSAKMWGLFDMFSDHSLLTGFLKHNKLDNAQKEMEELKHALNRFNSELNDVKVYDEVRKVNFDDFTKIFDIFFDNFFVDLYAISKISDSKRAIEKLRDEVTNVINQLERI